MEEGIDVEGTRATESNLDQAMHFAQIDVQESSRGKDSTLQIYILKAGTPELGILQIRAC